ncbi:hypothetical protein NECAME_11393 [Necator americanus]|uniref:Uncharacterized protein n=1 Tax=Necator americanus TaxID=51031 RepID=W2T4A6_NECAM|nr:hypothetical protein NECAME_11393 [Necator americanus]ETN76845.1 hypothetical protein NECAME_11393 [Necator americanus]
MTNLGLTVSYLLTDQPLTLPHGAIRTYHLGVTSNNHTGAKYTPTTMESDHDVIYHIHDALMSEVVHSVCREGYMDGNFTNDGKDVNIVCQSASISVKNMQATKTATVLLTLQLRFQDGEDTLVRKKYTVTVLHNNRLTILFRLKSEVIDSNDPSLQHSDQIFSMLSEVMRSYVHLPLPVPADAQTDRSMIKLQSDRVIFATDFVFTKR